MCGERCHHHHEGVALRDCCPSGGEVRGFVQPWLLLLLVQQPTHGYELLERLGGDEELPGADPGMLYRTLRQLEAQGLVRSTWETTGTGPARRRYEVTPDGAEVLHAWAGRVRATRRRLDRFLQDYGECFSGDGVDDTEGSQVEE